MKPFFAMPADGWYNIAIAGEFPHSTGYVQVLDGDAFKAIVQDIHAQQGRPNWPGILVDFDHDSLDPARPSTAAGWLTDIEERPDGLWAQIRWSDTGQKALEGGSFRFVSPVWMVDDCEDLGDKRLRPKRLMNCAITNCPNIKGMIPLTNRTDAGDKSRFSPPARPLPFVERVSVPVAALRAIEGDVLENARRPLTDKQRKLLWARASENGGSPYQGSPSKRVRDLLKKNPNASTNDIIKARTGNREAQAKYHENLQDTRNEWKSQDDAAREKAKADRKLIGGSSHYDWTRRSSGERKSGTKLKTGTGLPKSGNSADLDKRRGDREDAAKDRLNLDTQYKGKLTVDSLNRAMDRLNEHRQQRKEYAGVSHSKKPLDNRALFLANTAWEDMTDQQRRWWWATMGGSGPNGASRIDPYSPDGGTASPIAAGAGASGGVGPTRANEFWNEVYGNVDNPDWQPTMSEVDSMWESVGTGATDDDWRAFFQRSAAGNQKLRDDFAEIRRHDTFTPVQLDALDTLQRMNNDWTTDFGAGALRGFGNFFDMIANVPADTLTGWFDLADLGTHLVGVQNTLVGKGVSALHSGIHSLVDPVNNFWKTKVGITAAINALGKPYVDSGREGDWADITSKISSGISVAAFTAAAGLLGQANKLAKAARMAWDTSGNVKLGGSLNPFNKVKPVEIPKPGVGNYETAYIRPTERQLAADLKRFDEIVNAHFAPEGVDYVASRASLRDLEQSVSALQDIGRETYTGQVKAFEEALESWRNAYSGGGLSSELRAAERARVKELANLPTTAAERAAIEEAAYAREMWGIPDSTAKALYQDDLARLSQDAARRKMGDSMGRDVFEKAAAKRELEQARLHPELSRPMTFQEYLDGVESLEPPSKTVKPKPAPAPEYDIWDEAFEEYRNGDWAQRPGAGPVSQLGTPAEIPGRPLTAPAKAPAAAPAVPKTPTAPEATPAPVKPASAAAEAEARAAWRQFGDDFADALDEYRSGDVLQRPGAGPTSQLGTPAEVPNKPASAPASGKPLTGDEALVRLRQQAASGDTAPGTWDQLEEWADRIAKGGTSKPVAAASETAGRARGPTTSQLSSAIDSIGDTSSNLQAHTADLERRMNNLLAKKYNLGEQMEALDMRIAQGTSKAWERQQSRYLGKRIDELNDLISQYSDRIALARHSEMQAHWDAAIASGNYGAPALDAAIKSLKAAHPPTVPPVNQLTLFDRLEDALHSVGEVFSSRPSVRNAAISSDWSAISGKADLKAVLGMAIATLATGSLAHTGYKLLNLPSDNYVVVPQDTRTRTASLSSPPPVDSVPYSPDGRRLWYHAYDNERAPQEVVQPFRVQDETGALLDASGRVRGFADGTESPVEQGGYDWASLGIAGTRTRNDDKPHPLDAVRASAAGVSELREALASIEPQYVKIEMDIPSATPSDEAVALVRQNAGGAAKESAAILQAKIAELEQERAKLQARAYAVPVPDERPTEYQNIQHVRQAAMAAGLSSGEVLEAVRRAQRENSDVSRLKMDIRKAKKGLRTDKQRARAEADVLASFNSAYNDAVKQNETNDKLAAKRLARIDSQLDTLNRAYRYATERAQNAEERAEERLRSKTQREQEKALRAQERAQREADRKARLDASLKVKALKAGIRSLGREAVSDYKHNREVWREVAASVLDGKSAHHAEALRLQPNLDWDSALSVVRGAYASASGARDRKTGRPLSDERRMNFAKGQFLDFPLPLVE